MLFGPSVFEASVSALQWAADAQPNREPLVGRFGRAFRLAAKRLIPLCALILAAYSDPASAAHERLRVVFLNPGMTGETFWDMVSTAMRAAAAQLDIDIEILCSERNYQTLRQQGLEVVGRPKPPDYLIVVNEKAAATPVVEAANRAGVKTFMLLNGFVGPEAQQYGAPRSVLTNWIGVLEPDAKAAGARMAQALIAAADAQRRRSGDGKIHLLALAGDDSTPNSIARLDGLSAAVATRPDVVVDRRLIANWNAGEAETLTGRYLEWAAHVGVRPAGIWAANDAMALGAIQALETKGVAPGEDIGVVGLNWSPQGFAKVRDGEMLLTDGGHFLGGAWALVMLRDYADGCDFAARGAAQSFPLAAIDRSNLMRVVDLIGDRKLDRIDFKSFLATDRRSCGDYDFSLDALLRAVPPAP